MGDVDNLMDLLPIYYSRLFPYELYYKWLSYGSSDMFSRREFSFTLQDDIYIRFQAFKERKSLEFEMKRIVPFKIDIGAIYNVSPRLQKLGLKLEPVERELIFDIDMTDYDEVRTCCSGAEICNKCWKYMTVACKILDVALRDDFGFEHLLWVFSGRRGIHCWVCDKKARTMNPQCRSAVTSYLTLIKGGEFKKKKVKLPAKIHPSIQRAIGIVEQYFMSILEEQDLLGTEERMQEFVSILADDLQQEVKEVIRKETTTVRRWNAFVEHSKDQISSGHPKWRWQRHLVYELMIQYVYPRLDINVTKGLNHLLKSPFCVHPKTGKVSIPFNIKKADDFDPMKVPVITTLIEEVNAFDAQRDLDEQKDLLIKSKNIKDYKKTSLKTSLFVFQEFLQKLEVSNRGAKIEQSDLKMEF